MNTDEQVTQSAGVSPALQSAGLRPACGLFLETPLFLTQDHRGFSALRGRPHHHSGRLALHLTHSHQCC